MMGSFLLALLVAVCVTCLVIAIGRWLSSDDKAPEEPEMPVAFPSANVRLNTPTGFAVALDFEGFGLPESQASVLVLKLDGPFSQVEAGFTAEAMLAQGMTLLSKDAQTVGTLSGVLLQVRQAAGGIDFEKWILAFGDAEAVHLVTATYPQAEAMRFSSQLKATVLTARRDQEKTSADESSMVSRSTVPNSEAGVTAPFRVDGGSDLKLAREMGKMLAFTRDGSFPISSPTEALFVVAPSLGAVTVTNRNQFARTRIQQTEQVRGVTITAQSPVRVDDLDGVEIVARATDTKTGVPLSVYQTLLFDADGYYLMQGLVGLEESATYLPVFKTVARTFRRSATR